MEAKTRCDKIVGHIRYIRALVERGGPQPAEYDQFNAWVSTIYEMKNNGRLSTDDFIELRNALGVALAPFTMQGFAYSKPHGYAGDFEIIDRIYQQYICPLPHLARWDHFAHEQASLVAVRNRKTYFHTLLDLHSERTKALRVLKIASGPGRSMFEWMTNKPESEATFHCVELDANAIAFARALNRPFEHKVQFTQKNALRFNPEPGAYDLIWAAGIFDYFNDKIFVNLLRRLLNGLADSGELVIGNFSTRNPSRPYMELVGAWILQHRSEDDLLRLAKEAGVESHRARIGAEPAGVNLFLHISAAG